MYPFGLDVSSSRKSIQLDSSDLSHTKINFQRSEGRSLTLGWVGGGVAKQAVLGNLGKEEV